MWPCTSPIIEIIERGEHLLEQDVSLNPFRFRYLNLLDFMSCVGVPVQYLGKSHYALFMFHPHPGHFTHTHLQQAILSAGFLGAAIARKDVEDLIRRLHPFIFVGQLGSSLVHEINQRLGAVLNDANTLSADRKMLEKEPTMILSPEVRKRMGDCADNIQTVARSMGGVTNLFLSLARKEARDSININETIHQAIRFLSSYAKDHKVMIITDLEGEMPPTMTIGVHLEQIIMNIVLNAIQQTSIAKGGGELVIRTSFEPQAGQLPIKARFIDTGPGIHGRHLERIFEFGFSTRPGGTGLGLFIAKGLAESLGGRIGIEESVIFRGTTVLVEWPLLVPSLEGERH